MGGSAETGNPAPWQVCVCLCVCAPALLGCGWDGDSAHVDAALVASQCVCEFRWSSRRHAWTHLRAHGAVSCVHGPGGALRCVLTAPRPRAPPLPAALRAARATLGTVARRRPGPVCAGSSWFRHKALHTGSFYCGSSGEGLRLGGRASLTAPSPAWVPPQRQAQAGEVPGAGLTLRPLLLC